MDVTSNKLGRFGKDYIIFMSSHLNGNIKDYVCITCLSFSMFNVSMFT